MSTSSSSSSLRRRRSSCSSSSSRLRTTVITLMLSYGVTPSQCFQTAHGLTMTEPRVATRRFFRNAAEQQPAFNTDALLANGHHSHHNPMLNVVQPITAAASSASVSEEYAEQLEYSPSQPVDTTSTVASAPYDAYAPAEPQWDAQQDPYAQPTPDYAQQPQYQHYDENYSSSYAADTAASSSPSSFTSSNTLPTWLATPKDSLWESTWYQLQDAMLQSFFTPQETQRLLHSIETAARGDRHQMASAAEFCLILVETMEMGLSALMAAAHHVCACVTARQQGAYGSHSASSYYDHAFDTTNTNSYHHSTATGAEDENHHVALIAKDAGRLKTLEMVAAMIYSDRAANRVSVTPDAQDAENLRSLLLTETKDWRALAIRSAAALYRLKGILQHAHKTTTGGIGSREIPHITAEAQQSAREALYIYAPLASRLGMHRLKNELEGAAFRILYRRQHERVNRLARELRPRHSKPHLNRGLVEMCQDNRLDISGCMKSVLEAVKADMTRLLAEDAHFAQYVQDFSVTARVKEPYSLWKKMLRNRCRAIREVPDAIALRIVLEAKPLSDDEDDSVRRARERALCYYAQKLCMEHWQPVADNPRFKDYIESPKRNGYQSLHYTAHTTWDEEDWNLEIQVRSLEMHQVAEFGLASHWDYKQQQTMNHHPPHRRPENNNANAHDSSSNGVPPPEVALYPGGQSSDAYLRSVQEWHWQQHSGTQPSWMTADIATTESEERADRIRARTKKLLPYIEALTAAQSDLARDHVFVFLTTAADNHSGKGSVLALPAGACVLDALREGEREWGFRFPDEVSLNGERLDKVTGRLQNGDILTVPVSATTTAIA